MSIELPPCSLHARLRVGNARLSDGLRRRGGGGVGAAAVLAAPGRQVPDAVEEQLVLVPIHRQLQGVHDHPVSVVGDLGVRQVGGGCIGWFN